MSIFGRRFFCNWHKYMGALSSTGRQLLDFAVYFVVRILICLVQALPLRLGCRLASWAAWLAGDVFQIRGKVVEENLAYAFPALSREERKRLARKMWEHLFLMVLEIAHAPRKIHQTNWREFVELNGVSGLVKLLLDKRPVLIVTGHLGNFEVGGYVLGLLGFPTHTIARPLDNPYLDRFVNRFRAATGQHIIPKNGSYERILDVLARGQAMTFLADQYAGEKGCWVDFFGRPTSAHKAIALLALENDALVAVCAARRKAGPMHFELENHTVFDPRSLADSPNAVPQLTQWYTHCLEEMIRQTPEQYWWLHRRWKGSPPKKRVKQAA